MINLEFFYPIYKTFYLKNVIRLECWSSNFNGQWKRKISSVIEPERKPISYRIIWKVIDTRIKKIWKIWKRISGPNVNKKIFTIMKHGSIKNRFISKNQQKCHLNKLITNLRSEVSIFSLIPNIAFFPYHLYPRSINFRRNSHHIRGKDSNLKLPIGKCTFNVFAKLIEHDTGNFSL